ncbi:putative quinol monooxygenase [Gordonia terrae]|uniref:putative quinol monooxygenase n=1 Tax=Gordonia terrae TaxID=2055 RepID=UPI0015DEF318|nr:putative quinol monooxygenase [Gordonia terrae]
MSDSQPVVVVAVFVPKPDKNDEVEAAIREAVSATHANDRGCELYAAHRSVRGREGFVIIEKWASADDLQTHGGGEAFAALSAAVGDILAEPLDVTILQPLPAGDSKLGEL